MWRVAISSSGQEIRGGPTAWILGEGPVTCSEMLRGLGRIL
jgi:hypothetical protein